MNFCNLGCDLEFWWVLQMFLDLAQFRRTNERVMVFLGKGGWNQNFKIDLIYHVSRWIGVGALYDPDAVRWQAALLAEAKHINACAGCDGGEEHFKR